MEYDLEGLLSDQEIHRSGRGAFSDDLSAVGFRASKGVTVTVLATGDRYVAWTTHAELDRSRGATGSHEWRRALTGRKVSAP